MPTYQHTQTYAHENAVAGPSRRVSAPWPTPVSSRICIRENAVAGPSQQALVSHPITPRQLQPAPAPLHTEERAVVQRCQPTDAPTPPTTAQQPTGQNQQRRQRGVQQPQVTRQEEERQGDDDDDEQTPAGMFEYHLYSYVVLTTQRWTSFPCCEKALY